MIAYEMSRYNSKWLSSAMLQSLKHKEGEFVIGELGIEAAQPSSYVVQPKYLHL
jgi:hypothetical protein